MIFKDKTVIITGGSEGIGAAAARGFAEAGANLLLVARNRKKLEALAQELRDKTRVEIFAMDVADPDASVDLFKKADYDFGRIDILVNNAGCHERGPVEKVEAAELARMVDVNLRAPILLSRLRQQSSSPARSCSRAIVMRPQQISTVSISRPGS